MRGGRGSSQSCRHHGDSQSRAPRGSSQSCRHHGDSQSRAPTAAKPLRAGGFAVVNDYGHGCGTVGDQAFEPTFI